MKRRFTEAQKRQMEENKTRLIESQGGKCFYCDIDFNRDNVYPHAAHIIIPSVVNVRKYGYEILDHYLNFKGTCPNCNSKAIISNPESQTGIDHIAMIQKAIDENSE